MVVVSANLPPFLAGAMAVVLRDSLGLTASGLGLSVAAYFLAAALLSMPFGRLVDRIGGARVLRLSAFGTGLVLAAMATVVTSDTELMISLVVGGAVGAAAQPAANQCLSRSVPPDRQGTAFGITQAAIPVAVLFSGLAVPTIAVTAGYQWGFGAGAGLSVLTAAMTWSLRVPAGQGRPRDRDHATRPHLLPLAVLATGLGLGLASATGMATFLVSSAVDVGLSTEQAGVVAAVGGAAAAAGRLVTGLVADQRARRHLRVIAVMLTVGAAGYAALGLATSTGTIVLFVLATIVAFGVGWGWNGLFNFAVVRAHALTPIGRPE